MKTTPKPKKKRRGGLCGALIAIVAIGLLALIVSCDANAGKAAPTSPTLSDQQVAATNAANVNATDVAFAQTPLVQDTPAAQPTQQPTHQATTAPTAQPTQRATPKPTQAPTCQAINNNPWCYNFSPGNLITNVPADFCSYFNCIRSFVSADDPDGGYVVECADTTYSQSGGESGACSQHGGVMRPLYSHYSSGQKD